MSVHWFTYGFVGCKIDKPYTTIKERNCHHEESTLPFCGQCGCPMWKVRNVLSPILDDLEEDSGLGKLGLIRTTDDKCYVGIMLADLDECKCSKLITLDKFDNKNYKALFKRTLKDLYKEENFGFWMTLDAG